MSSDTPALGRNVPSDTGNKGSEKNKMTKVGLKRILGTILIELSFSCLENRMWVLSQVSEINNQWSPGYFISVYCTIICGCTTGYKTNERTTLFSYGHVDEGQDKE